MIHIAFNYHDPAIQLRLDGLFAAALIVICCLIFEIYPKRHITLTICLIAITLFSMIIMGEALLRMGGGH